MTVLTFGLFAPDDGDQSSGTSGWFAKLRANFVALDAHTHNNVNSAAIPFANVSPLTTKGDLISFSTVNARVPIGSDNQILTADSTQTLGLKWAAPATSPDASDELSNLALACSVAASALTVSLKTKAGTDASSGSPVKIGFRSSTAATGTYNQRTVTSSLSVVVSSGSTLGHASAVAQYIYVYALDNSGTVELAVSSTLYDEGTRQSTSAEGGAGAADSNTTIYSTTARSNVPLRLIGRLNSTQATAGTWAAVPSEISLTPFERPPAFAKYSTNTNTSIANGVVQILDFEDKVNDTMNCVTIGAAWKFTAPRTKQYLVIAAARLEASANWATDETVELYAYVDGALDSIMSVYTFDIGTAGSQPTVSGSTVVQMTAGSFVDIRLFQNSGAARLLSTTAGRVFVCVREL